MTSADLTRLGLAIDAEWLGLCGERRGAIVGYALVFWPAGSPEGLIYLYMLSSSARPWWLPIAARRFLDQVAAETELETLATYPDNAVPGARRWLEWLGFEPTGEIFEESRDEVWVKRLRGEHVRREHGI